MASTSRANDWTQSAHTHCPQAPLPGVFYRENSDVQGFAQGHTENEACNSTDTLKESACKCLVYAFLGAAAPGSKMPVGPGFPRWSQCTQDTWDPVCRAGARQCTPAPGTLLGTWGVPEPRVGAHPSSMAARLQAGSGARYLQVSHLCNELSPSTSFFFFFNKLAFEALKIPHKIYTRDCIGFSLQLWEGYN